MQAEALAVEEELVEDALLSGFDVEERAGQLRRIESYLCFAHFGYGCKAEGLVAVVLSPQGQGAHTRQGVLGV